MTIHPCLDSVHRETMLRNAHALVSQRHKIKTPLWSIVGEIAGVGCTSACQICKELGWNPHAPAKDPLPR